MLTFLYFLILTSHFSFSFLLLSRLPAREGFRSSEGGCFQLITDHFLRSAFLIHPFYFILSSPSAIFRALMPSPEELAREKIDALLTAMRLDATKPQHDQFVGSAWRRDSRSACSKIAMKSIISSSSTAKPSARSKRNPKASR